MLRILSYLMAATPLMPTRQRGATLIEYALIIAVIAVVVLGGGMVLSNRLDTFFNTDVADAIKEK